jgi:hypothetical protein
MDSPLARDLALRISAAGADSVSMRLCIAHADTAALYLDFEGSGDDFYRASLSSVRGLPYWGWVVSTFSEVTEVPVDSLRVIVNVEGRSVAVEWPGVLRVNSGGLGWNSPAMQRLGSPEEQRFALALRLSSTMRRLAPSGIAGDRLPEIRAALERFLTVPPRTLQYDVVSTTPRLEIAVRHARSEIERQPNYWQRFTIKIESLPTGSGLTVICDVSGSWNTGGNSPPNSYRLPIPVQSLEAYATRICDHLVASL